MLHVGLHRRVMMQTLWHVRGGLSLMGRRCGAQEHVQNCRTSAQCAVASMLDPSTPEYDYLPYFYSRIFNLSWQARMASSRGTPHLSQGTVLLYLKHSLSWNSQPCQYLQIGAPVGVPCVMAGVVDVSAPATLQFYGINEGAQPLMFGDPGAGKFGSYFVKDGKVRLTWHAPLWMQLSCHLPHSMLALEQGLATAVSCLRSQLAQVGGS